MTLYEKVIIDSFVDYEVNLSHEDVKQNPKILDYVRNNLAKTHRLINKMSPKEAEMFRCGILKSFLNTKVFNLTEEYKQKIQKRLLSKLQ